MGEVLSYTGKLIALEMKNTTTGVPYIEIKLDEMVFRYFEHGEDHKKETLEGLKKFMSSPLTVKYTEKPVEGRKYPYRNITEFPVLLESAADKKMGSQEQEEAGGKTPAAPAGPGEKIPTEETVSEDENDPDVQLYRKCIKLSLLAWEPQFNVWKDENQELRGTDLMKRIGETATSFYITKVKERR